MGVFWREMRTVKIVRNPVIARLKGTSGNSKGERFFDLLNDRPWVRIPPGSPFCLPDSTVSPKKAIVKPVGFFFYKALWNTRKLLTEDDPC